MIPRLQRYYGGDPWWWLAEAPAALVRAFRAMLPRLDAEEALASASIQALGSGALEKDDARRLERALRRAARGGEPMRAAKADPTAIPAMGIGVKVVERRDV